jgi:uncharacterized membrane protein YbhN (UPF0104 family)
MSSKFLRTILTLVVLVVFAVYFLLNINQFKILLHVNFYLLIVIAIGNFLNIASSGLFIKIILKPFGKFISLVESTYVALISTVGNFFAPAGSGFGFRAIYLKKRHGLSYSDYMTTLYGNYIIVFLVNAFFGLLSLYLLRAKHNDAFFVLVMVFGGMFAASLLLSLVRIPSRVLEYDLKNAYLNKLTKILLQMLEGWNGIVANRKLMAKLTSLIVINFAMAMFVAKTEIVALHLTISFSALMLFSVLGSLSLFVSITPANLGVKEAIYIFSAHVIGFSTSQILSIALIDRGVLFITLVVLWLYSSKTKAADVAVRS